MEFVFVVPRERVFPECFPQGFTPFGEAFRREAFEEAVLAHGFFVERDHAERTPSLKQIIPYTVVRRAEDVLLMRRLSTGGEGRLHGKRSIGVGGHINPEDVGPNAGSPGDSVPRNPIEAGTWREISEEIVLEGRTELTSLGLINDDSNPVGAVHLGLAQILTVDGTVSIREEDVLEGDLTPPTKIAALLAEGADFETWSSILIESLGELFPNTLPAYS